MARPLVLALAAALLLAGCEGSNPADSANPSQKARPSPLPYGYKEPKGQTGQPPPQAEGEQLDAIVAVVWGEVLTRRRLIREAGPIAEGQDKPSYEKGLAVRRLRWAREQLFVKAAELEGLHIPPAMLDEAVRERMEDKVKEMSKNTGRPVTFEEYLHQQNMSAEEFRISVRNQEIQNALLRKHLVGLGKGTRPGIDWNVTPAEVRRMYREQPKLFDDPQKAAFVMYQLRYIDQAVGDVSPVEAEALTQQKAEAIAQAFRAGEDPEAIAKRFAIDPRAWTMTTKPVEGLAPLMKPVETWVLAPERKKGEATVLTPPRMGGPLVVGVLEVVPAKKNSFEDSYDDVVEQIRFGRRLRMEALLVIELVQGGAVAWPAALADELVEQARDTLAELDKHPVYGRAHFR